MIAKVKKIGSNEILWACEFHLNLLFLESTAIF